MSLAENGSKIGRTPAIPGETVLDSVVKNPDYAKNGEILVEAVNVALSIHKKALFHAGVRPAEIVKSNGEIINGLRKPHEGKQRAMRLLKVAHDISSQNGNGNGNRNGGEIK